jgi:hypothetical protein
MAMNRAQVAAIACGLCGSLPRRRAAAASDGAYAGIRRHVQTMLWVRACHSAHPVLGDTIQARHAGSHQCGEAIHQQALQHCTVIDPEIR